MILFLYIILGLCSVASLSLLDMDMGDDWTGGSSDTDTWVPDNLEAGFIWMPKSAFLAGDIWVVCDEVGMFTCTECSVTIWSLMWTTEIASTSLQTASAPLVFTCLIALAMADLRRNSKSAFILACACTLR